MMKRALILSGIVVVLLGWGSDARADDPYPYHSYLPVICRNAYLFPTQVITIPIAVPQCSVHPEAEDAVILSSAGHTYDGALNPSGDYIVPIPQALGAGVTYEADYGTWYYLERGFADVAIPPLPGPVVTASLVFTGVVSGYDYPYPPPVVRLNVGYWPDAAFPDDFLALWQDWDRNAFLADYVSGFDTTESGDPYDPRLLEAVVLPLDTRYITPGGRLKFVWRYRDDEMDDFFRPESDYEDVGVGVLQENGCENEEKKTTAVLEIGYIP